MRRAGIVGIGGRRKWKYTPPDTISADLVKREFARPGPNQLWVTDITEHRTREGKVYCAVVLDAYSRRIVGWSIDSSPDRGAGDQRAWAWRSTPATAASAAGTVIHSDHGVQFASWAFTERAKDSGLVPSMGSIGDCYDNSMIEVVLVADAGRTPRPADAGRPGSSWPTRSSTTSRSGTTANADTPRSAC